MTDEEMAEEYEDKAEYLEVNDYGQRRYSSIDIQEAYLAGLKAGRPQWHDLRKNPYDLPTEIGEYWCKWDDGTYCTVHYFGECFGDYVIAWCEIPKFER